jgi:hypothetical protein
MDKELREKLEKDQFHGKGGAYVVGEDGVRRRAIDEDGKKSIRRSSRGQRAARQGRQPPGLPPASRTLDAARRRRPRPRSAPRASRCAG